jgi:hypothetical protein
MSRDAAAAPSRHRAVNVSPSCWTKASAKAGSDAGLANAEDKDVQMSKAKLEPAAR